MAGKGGGAWKVAYADFVTAMMAFFLVMWLVASNDKAKKAVAEYFRSPWHPSLKNGGGSAVMPGKTKMPNGPSAVLTNAKGGSGSGTSRTKSGSAFPVAGAPEKQPNDSVLNKINVADKPSQFSLQPRRPRGHGVPIPFDENSCELNDAALTLLKRLVPELRGKPNRIDVRGHATHRPLPPESGFKDTWDLCYKRSHAVMDYLGENGIERERMRLSQDGPNDPLTLSVEEGLQSQNARVEIYLLDEFYRDPKTMTAER
ncbi:MAG: flagellar motor protein MotB [Pirellulales bacterium]